MSDSSSPSPTADRELAVTRIFDAPRELVWKMWTHPNHIAQWWGPRGFTTTTFEHEAKPGGVWRFVMHGPDGTDYPNQITFIDVVAPERLAYKHAGDANSPEPIHFEVTVTFESQPGDKTKMHMRMLFPSTDVKRTVIDRYGADKGLVETVTRLGEHLAANPFVITRTFDAPRDLVWRAWTQRDQLVQWFGPKGFTMTQANLDFRPGGSFHYRLAMPNGGEMWGKFIYREIDQPKRITWVNTFSNAEGGLSRHPLAPEWPQQMLTTATFVEYDGKTTVTIVSASYQSTDSERNVFDTNHESMRNGWGGTFDQLAGHLAG